MTRVVVQRGQPSTGSLQSRSSSSTLVPAPAVSSVATSQTSAASQPSIGISGTLPSPYPEDDVQEPRQCDFSAVAESSNSTFNTEVKAKEPLFPENDNDGEKEHRLCKNDATIKEGDVDISRQSPNGAFKGNKDSEIGTVSSVQEQPIIQSEESGTQKVHSDGRTEGITHGNIEESKGMQNKSDAPTPPPTQNSGGEMTSVFQFSVATECGTKSVADATPGTSSVPPGLLPAARRTGLGNPVTSGSRATTGPSRKHWRSIRSSKSPPQNSRSSSPRSYVDADGYNSADEQNAWALAARGLEDNDDRERQFEIEIRRSRGLEIRRMAEDGNCLFRAVADQVYGDPEMHGETRQMCIDYMEKERDHFSQFVIESFSAYCKRKRRDKTFGNNLEIQAMAEMYNRPIHIYSYGIEPKNIFQGSYETDSPPIRLSYHRGNHYNSLVDPLRSTVGAGLGFGSLHGANVDRDQVKAAIKAQQDWQIDKALLAEGRFYSDLELTEHEMERMVIEASRAEFLAEEYGYQLGCEESSTSAAGTSTSQGGTHDNLVQASSTGFSSTPDGSITSNMRMLLSMGFSYFRVVEAYNIFDDDINGMLCYLLETEAGGLFEDSVYRMKGKAAER